MNARGSGPRPPHRGEGAEDDGDAWSRATAGVRPIADRHRTVTPRRCREGAEPGADSREHGPPPGTGGPSTRREGRAPGIDAGRLAALRRGEPRPDATLDLHGLSQDRVEPALGGALSAESARGTRCLLVVHEPGDDSRGRAVLREAVTRFLSAAVPDGRALAFAGAEPRDGGDGATYVLLSRAPRSSRRAAPPGPGRT